ncbi:hypothetical protein A2U01_0081604, partial [Trifolium medium]|nr:hypothetical protein [Trifolium medium]
MKLQWPFAFVVLRKEEEREVEDDDVATRHWLHPKFKT